jgi:CubicO group peptidase (beta-lactamase class C family)
LKVFLAGYELPRDPGASYEYSNLGFGLLTYALAQLKHTTYGVLTDSQILKPLGMTMSSIEFTEAMRAHLAPVTMPAGWRRTTMTLRTRRPAAAPSVPWPMTCCAI